MENSVEKIKQAFKQMLFTLFILILGFTTGYLFAGRSVKKTSKERPVMVMDDRDTFTVEKFKQTLKDLNVRYPHIVYAQAVLETGHFHSMVFRYNNNLFGMKEARQRATTNKGADLGYAMYHHWKESVLDYALYQCAYLSRINSEDKYYRYLSENYAGDKRYMHELKQIAQTFK